MTGLLTLPPSHSPTLPLSYPQNLMEPIHISYFSDVLCIWAYIAQIRLDELNTTFQDRIAIAPHFVPVFGNAREKLENRWRDKGGFKGYSEHVRAVVKKFDHITVHPDIWTDVIPPSSTSCHLFLHAIQLLEMKGIIPKSERVFDKAIWAFREAFFTKLANVSDRKVQFGIAEELGLLISAIQEQIDSGEAYAQLSKDFDLVKEHSVAVSPTLIFNEQGGFIHQKENEDGLSSCYSVDSVHDPHRAIKANP